MHIIRSIFTFKHLVFFFWLGSSITVLVYVKVAPHWWDFNVYWTAAQSLNSGSNPYADGIAVQKAFHDAVNKDTDGMAPMTYVYSPMTLLLLRMLSRAPFGVAGTLFGIALACGFILQLWAAWQMASVSERRWLPLFLPAVMFFPGLLHDDVVMSGNVAYILYGLVLAAAVAGWKKNRWHWYYAAVLLASCCKGPLLTLLAFPILVGRKQWRAALVTGVAGCMLFTIQAWLWPTLFREYLRAVQLQFDWNMDFGMGPAGILGRALVKAGLPYSQPATTVYLAFAIMLGGLLVWMAKEVDLNLEARSMWIPVALVGTILLNPRVKEYDIAAITVPMLLIGWRGLRQLVTPGRLVEEGRKYNVPLAVASVGWFLAANFIGTEEAFGPVELALLLILLGMGVWLTLKQVSDLQFHRLPVHEEAETTGTDAA
jgi:hypothetical protein